MRVRTVKACALAALTALSLLLGANGAPSLAAPMHHSAPKPAKVDGRARPRPEPRAPKPAERPRRGEIARYVSKPVESVSRPTRAMGAQAIARAQKSAAGHPENHIAISPRDLKARASASAKRIQERQRRGDRLSSGDRKRLRDGVEQSSFRDARQAETAVGAALRDHSYALKRLPKDATAEVTVPFKRSIGQVYNTKTGLRNSSRARVIFRNNGRGAELLTAYVE